MVEEKTTESKPIEPNYLEQLDAKKKELLEIEARLDEKKSQIERDVSVMMMSGRTVAGQAQPQKTEKEIEKERLKTTFENFGINPFKGKGSEALK